ncbi:hypothetical protein EVAR_31967_1 [Eumeta japonica]|uniref:Uncharacterized protein n=1 Tax=Eumeta variegata TaxID=151549 RepID=A0A4C1VT10_EUMVA|nr:hypothetical protein EVAR_31967_1 [Eumeta japonica]
MLKTNGLIKISKLCQSQSTLIMSHVVVVLATTFVTSRPDLHWASVGGLNVQVPRNNKIVAGYDGAGFIGYAGYGGYTEPEKGLSAYASPRSLTSVPSAWVLRGATAGLSREIYDEVVGASATLRDGELLKIYAHLKTPPLPQAFILSTSRAFDLRLRLELGTRMDFKRRPAGDIRLQSILEIPQILTPKDPPLKSVDKAAFLAFLITQLIINQ